MESGRRSQRERALGACVLACFAATGGRGEDGGGGTECGKAVSGTVPLSPPLSSLLLAMVQPEPWRSRRRRVVGEESIPLAGVFLTG